MIAIVGPTATGKSDLAVRLALALDGDVVNADAMQLYRGMDVGTAKLPLVERRGIVHHLLDVLEVSEEASVAAYQRHARAAMEAIDIAGRRAVLAGGSGLYLRAALDELEIPPTDPEVRHRLEVELDRMGPAALHERLSHLDPRAVETILPGNGRRIVRALEVIQLTGRPFTATLPEGRQRRYHRPTVQLGLTMPRPELDRRIEVRVHRMWELGLVGEVETLLTRGLARGRTASRALGYAQVLDLLAGRIDEAGARERTVTATRRFARRQESWFRRDPRIIWLAHDHPGLVAAALRIIESASSADAAPDRDVGHDEGGPRDRVDR